MDGCGDGEIRFHVDGLVDKIYRLWNRDPVTVSRDYMMSFGKVQRPARANLSSY